MIHRFEPEPDGEATPAANATLKRYGEAERRAARAQVARHISGMTDKELDAIARRLFEARS